jgi:hypothetical protein
LVIDGAIDPLVLAFDELGLWPYHDVYLPLLLSHEN